MLCVENLSVSVHNQPILHNISFAIQAAATLAIIGPSGSGKTTLSNTILGITNGTNVCGIIRWQNQIIQRDKELLVPRNARGFSYIPQSLALWPHLTVEETLLLSNRFSQGIGIDRTWLNELLTRLGLFELRSCFPNTLSGGEKQRLALARALATNPRMLILDEPFSALDLVAKKSLLATLRNVHHQSPSSMIFITHDLHDALAIGQHLLVLEHGRMIWYGPRDKVSAAIFTSAWNPMA